MAEIAKLIDAEATAEEIKRASAIQDKEREQLADEQRRKIAMESISYISELETARIEAKKLMLDTETAMIMAAIHEREQAWAGMFALINTLGGEMSKGIGMFAGGVKGTGDAIIGMQAISDVGREGAAGEAAARNPYAAQYSQAVEHYAAMISLYEQGRASELEVNMAYDRMQIAHDQATKATRLSIASSLASGMAGIMYSLYQASGQQNEAAFKAYQAFAIAQAVIDTYAMAVASYKAMAGIPYVGPALGAAAAAAAIAYGMSQVAAISSQKPGGASSGGAGISGGGYSYSQPTEPSWQKTGAPAEKEPSIIINLHVAGSVVTKDELARDLVPLLKKAYKDRVH
jgi:hypothetical protein